MGKMTVDNYKILRLICTKMQAKKHRHRYFHGMFGIIKKSFPHTFWIGIQKGKVIPFCVTFMSPKNFKVLCFSQKQIVISRVLNSYLYFIFSAASPSKEISSLIGSFV